MFIELTTVDNERATVRVDAIEAIVTKNETTMIHLRNRSLHVREWGVEIEALIGASVIREEPFDPIASEWRGLIEVVEDIAVGVAKEANTQAHLLDQTPADFVEYGVDMTEDALAHMSELDDSTPHEIASARIEVAGWRLAAARIEAISKGIEGEES